MSAPKDCGDVLSPWPGIVLNALVRDGIYLGIDGALHVIVDGKVRRAIIVRH